MEGLRASRPGGWKKKGETGSGYDPRPDDDDVL